MPRLNLAPTKSNQLALRRDLAMASEGFSLLDQKREILVMELMRLLDRARDAQKTLAQLQARAYDTLRKAITQNGFHRMQSIAAGVEYKHQIESSTRVVAGVRVPEIRVRQSDFHSQFSFAGTDALVDQTMSDFLELLRAVSAMAQLETAVWQLARELKKTQRRVNALEQIFIPSFRDTLAHIGNVLEGKELESIFILKRVKKRLEEARAELVSGGQTPG
jgi:V/A-type H+-transporting ATPase subunit D